MLSSQSWSETKDERDETVLLVTRTAVSLVQFSHLRPGSFERVVVAMMMSLSVVFDPLVQVPLEGVRWSGRAGHLAVRVAERATGSITVRHVGNVQVTVEEGPVLRVRKGRLLTRDVGHGGALDTSRARWNAIPEPPCYAEALHSTETKRGRNSG